MFTGIVEQIGEVVAVHEQGTNRHFRMRAAMAPELRVDQSVAHDGVCLTVTAVEDGTYTVTAVEETLRRTTLGTWAPGRPVNLERSLRVGDRLDGHLVQGHVDSVTPCVGLADRDGSHAFTFALPMEADGLVVHKGSVCINGVSLTVAARDATTFTVAIIPYTLRHTNFHALRTGEPVNVEYDVLGRYVQRLMAGRAGA
ncbi:MAG: riboflavin synthase [Flavobacteriales bacterium]|jgi:riboflavin synthase|nr:riboflavin synthase [Flavobacteriales bacterium]